MAVVTVDSAARNSYYSAGNIGWSAKSAFAYQTVAQELSGAGNTVFGNIATSEARAQSFTPAAAMDLTAVRLAIANGIGTNTDNVTVAIYSDTGANLPNASIAVADNVYSGTKLTSLVGWAEFHFLTPVSLSASTKYWIVLSRSGALDPSNYYLVKTNSSGSYSGGGASSLLGGVWSAESATTDLCFQVLAKVPSALYQVTQDTGVSPKLHVWKSTDAGANWTEQDAADAPTVADGAYPFDVCETRSGPYLVTMRLTATNTSGVRVFNMSTDQWDAADWGTTPPTDVVNTRPVRIGCDNSFVTGAPGAVLINFTDLTDDADTRCRYASTAASAWGVEQILTSATSTESSQVSAIVTDKAAPVGFHHRFQYQTDIDDFSTKSATGAGTFGTTTALSTAAADVDTEYASACYQIYQNGSAVDTIVAAFIDAGGTIQERILNLEVTSASVTMAADNAVDTAISTAGRQLATCSYNGTRYIIVSVSGTGITYYTSTVAGTWSVATSWKTGLTASSISNILSIEGYGLLVTYTDNGDVKVDWLVAPAAPSGKAFPFQRITNRNNPLLRR
jgi:hypothetical protein